MEMLVDVPAWIRGWVGGLLIGSSALLLMASQGKIAGISGVVGGLLAPAATGQRAGRAAGAVGHGALGDHRHSRVLGPDGGGRLCRGGGHANGQWLHLGARRLRLGSSLAAVAGGGDGVHERCRGDGVRFAARSGGLR